MTDNNTSVSLSQRAYNPSVPLPQGFKADHELSGENYQVSLDSQGTPHVAFRGTSKVKDIFPDIDIALGQRTHQRFGEAVDLTKRVEEKYGKQAVLTGHSLGGTVAQHVSEKLGGRQGKVFNPGKSLFGKSETTSSLTVERSPNDPISSGFNINPKDLRMSLLMNLAKIQAFHPLSTFRR